MDTGFKPVKGQQIMILHCVDARKDKTTEKLNSEDLDNKVGGDWMVRYFFECRGYKVVSDSRPASAMPPAELIVDMNDDELVTLAPKEAEFAYLFMLDDLVVEYTVLKKMAKAEGRAYIIDTRIGKVVWKEREVATSGGIGPFSGLFPQKKNSLQFCVWNMLETVPICANK
jgi:hypothetical protein